MAPVQPSSVLICGYESDKGPYICILPNGHQGEHAYAGLYDYYQRNLLTRREE